MKQNDPTMLAPRALRSARRPFLPPLAPWLPLVFTPLALWAQSNSDAAAPTGDTLKLAPYRVTATLRDEPLLTVPIAVSVVTGDSMMKQGWNSLADITQQTPSLTFRAGASNKDTSLLIRGVGTITTSPGTEPSVSTVVDGVVLARPGQSTMDLIDIDHVEILRGPQGTLFGKNSSVGAVNIVTKDPSGKGGFLNLGYFGGGTQYVVKAGISTTLVPQKLKAAFSIASNNYDGNVQNILLNQTVNGFSNQGGRLKLVYTPTDRFKAVFAAHYIKSITTTPNQGPLAIASTTAFPSGVTTPASAAQLAAQAPVAASWNNLTINSGLYGRAYDGNGGVSATLEWTLGDMQLTSISAYQSWYNNQFQDTSIAPKPLVGLTVSWDRGYVWFDQYSQELRLTSPQEGFVTYVGGLYFQRAIDKEMYRRDIVQQPTLGTLVNNSGEANYGVRNSNLAAYAEATWNFSSQFRAITGLRLTRDTVDFDHARLSTSPVAVPGIQPTHAYYTDKTSANGTSGRLGLQYYPAKDVMLYATYSRGYKGPAYNVFFNQTPLQVAALLPETSDTYEVGVKSFFFGNRAQFTVTGFDTTYHNYQANFSTLVVGTLVTNLINAGQVSSKGIEADLRARVTPGLLLTATAASITAKVDRFNTPPGVTSLDGRTLPFAPKTKYNVGAEYTLKPNDDYKVVLTTDYSWQSEMQFQLAQTPDTIQPAYGIWNASVSLLNPAGRWRVTVHGKNLADKHYAAFLQQGGGHVWRIAPRDTNRYFGVTVHRDF